MEGRQETMVPSGSAAIEPVTEPAGATGLHDDRMLQQEASRAGDASTPSGWVVPLGWTGHLPPGECRSCGAEVMWATTPSGKRSPLNPDGVSHFATCPQANRWRKPR